MYDHRMDLYNQEVSTGADAEDDEPAVTSASREASCAAGALAGWPELLYALITTANIPAFTVSAALFLAVCVRK